MGEENVQEQPQLPEELKARKSQFSEWFHQLMHLADIADQRYPFQGFLAYKPYGYEIFSRCIGILEELLAKSGHKKVYFPALVPERLLKKEERHIAGFGDEVFWVTRAGKNELAEPAALRPTSETVMYEMLRLWVRSWRDLPVKIHQSTSVWRYETKHTRPLVRDREILWNEGHSSHASLDEAEKHVNAVVEIYSRLFREIALPVVWVNVLDVFAGAISAYEPFTIFPDGRGLEMGSVNNLGQRFSKAFEVKFKKPDGTEECVWQASYGVSERLLAAIMAVHGDDKGLVIPPSVAPYHAVLVPIIYKENREMILSEAHKIAKQLKGLRIFVDEREETPGSKFYYWELRGVPLRIELGQKELEGTVATVVRRDTGEKISVPFAEMRQRTRALLKRMQIDMAKRAAEYHKCMLVNAKDLEQIKKTISNKKFCRVAWCGEIGCAAAMEKDADAHFVGYGPGGLAKGSCACPDCGSCGKDAKKTAYVGKTY